MNLLGGSALGSPMVLPPRCWLGLQPSEGLTSAGQSSSEVLTPWASRLGLAVGEKPDFLTMWTSAGGCLYTCRMAPGFPPREQAD